jgi:hypothetical protein
MQGLQLGWRAPCARNPGTPFSKGGKSEIVESPTPDCGRGALSIRIVRDNGRPAGHRPPSRAISAIPAGAVRASWRRLLPIVQHSAQPRLVVRLLARLFVPAGRL